MPDDVIDLRKMAQNKKAAPEQIEGPSAPIPSSASIEWEAYEYEERRRGPYWILFPGGVAVLLIILGILSQSYFFVAFTVLAFLVLMMYEKRGPQKLKFYAGADGISVGRRLYPHSELKSFWIFKRPDGKELSVETTHTLTPYLRIPLGDTNPEDIRQLLLRHLTEQEHKEFVTDQLARSFGL